MSEAPAVEIRTLVETDAEVSRAMGFEAFGIPATPPTEPAVLDRPGMRSYGAFLDGQLAARLKDRAFDSWFGGRLVPTCGVAGVTVAAEFRGRRLLTPLFTTLVERARERGAVVSGLFPTAPRIYRGFGYELIGSYDTVEVPTHALRPAPGPTRRLRRATESDAPAVRATYDRWAAAQNGSLSRRPPSHPETDADLIAETTGVTLALDDDGAVVGYACWDRGPDYGDDARLEVTDLVAVDAAGCRALLSALAGFASVTPVTRLDTSGADLVRTFLTQRDWRVIESRPYMLAVLDVVGALEARGYPALPSLAAVFAVHGAFAGGVDGGYRLSVEHGRARCERIARPLSDAPVLEARGLAQLYAGAQSCANLRFAGLLAGPNDHDETLDALFGGRQVHIRDYY